MRGLTLGIKLNEMGGVGNGGRWIELVDNGANYVNWDDLSDPEAITDANGITSTSDGSNYIDSKLELSTQVEESTEYTYYAEVTSNTLVTDFVLLRHTYMFENSIEVPAGTTGIFTGTIKTLTEVTANVWHSYIISAELIGNSITVKNMSLKKYIKKA